jgi:hypothetical protein
MSVSVSTNAFSSEPISAGRIWSAGALAWISSIVGNLVVRAIALAALPSATAFGPLGLVPIIFWTTIGILGATIVRALLRRSPNGLHVFVSTALIVLALSFVPDVLLLLHPIFAGTSVASVGALMALHVVAGVSAIGFLTLRPRE